MRKRSLGRTACLAWAAVLLSFALPLPALEAEKAPAAEEAPYRVGGKVSRPEKISGDPPVYTEAARKAGLQGVVILEAIIGVQGDVETARVLKGLPMGLDKQALEAAKTYKFRPAKLDGKPVRVYFTVTVEFRLD